MRLIKLLFKTTLCYYIPTVDKGAFSAQQLKGAAFFSVK